MCFMLVPPAVILSHRVVAVGMVGCALSVRLTSSSSLVPGPAPGFFLALKKKPESRLAPNRHGRKMGSRTAETQAPASIICHHAQTGCREMPWPGFAYTLAQPGAIFSLLRCRPSRP